MDIVQRIMTNFNPEALKEPRGFIKLLQCLFTICAFATTTSFSSILKLDIQCKDNSSLTEIVDIPIHYSFKLYQLTKEACGDKINLMQDFSSDSQFFVAVGVISFLFVVAALTIYTFYDKIYANDARIPSIDFVTHCLLSILLLAASSAWANSLTGLKYATSLETVSNENPNFVVSKLVPPDFAKLNISIILGFLNVFLFASNLWFIYKETIFFASRTNAAAASSSPVGEIPRV